MASHSMVIDAEHNDNDVSHHGQLLLKLIALGAVCTVVLLTMQYPVLLDDWAWGGSVGIERLRSGFAGYGGRYVGYLISMLLARCAPARIVVMSGTVIAIAYMTYSLAGKRRIDTFFVALAIVFCTPAAERGQTLAWASGFTNYVIPVALFQVYLLVTATVFEDEYAEPTIPLVVIVLLGLVNSLIMETVTLLNLVVPVVVCLICLIRFRTFPKHQLGYWLGSIAGAAAMFTNSAYHAVVSGSDTYRSVSEDIVASAIEKIVDSYSYYLSSLNWAILAPLLFLCLVCLFGSSEDVPSGTARHTFVLSVLSLFFVTALAFSIYCSFIATDDPGNLRNTISVAIMVLLFFAMLILLLLYHRHSWARLSIFVLICIVVVVAPLVVVNPVSERCFFPGYALEMLVVCILWDNIIKDESLHVSLLTAGLLFAVLTSNLSIYHEIHESEQERMYLFERAIDEGWEDIKLMPYPNPPYVYVGEPVSNYWKNIMKEYYGLPSDIEIQYKTLVPMVVPAQQG